MLGTEKFGQLGSFCILDLAALDISGEFCVLIGRLFWADQGGVSCPLTRFVNARKYLVQACGSFPISTWLDLSPGKYRIFIVHFFL